MFFIYLVSVVLLDVIFNRISLLAMHDYPVSCRIFAKNRIVQTSLRIFRFGPVVPEKIQILNLTYV